MFNPSRVLCRISQKPSMIFEYAMISEIREGNWCCLGKYDHVETFWLGIYI